MASAKQILNYERELKEAGTTDKQAEIHARRIAEIIENTLVTKDLFDNRLKENSNEIEKRFNKMDNTLDKIDSKIEMRIVQMEGCIYKFLITVMMAMMAVSGAMQTIFHFWR